MVRFSCPNCGKTYRAEGKAAGKKVTCSCGKSFLVPLEPPQGAQSPALAAEAPGREEENLFATLESTQEGQRIIPPRKNASTFPTWLKVILVILAIQTAIALVVVVAFELPDIGAGGTSAAGISFALLLVVLAVSYFGHCSGCPNCGKWWARILMKQDLLSQEEGYLTVPRVEQFRSPTGDLLYEKHKKEQVHAVFQTHRHYWKCKFCRHTWSEESTTAHEG
jgi:ssDNA-binding Zn-finger/Zn-ribbon topoisomerase 1